MRLVRTQLAVGSVAVLACGLALGACGSSGPSQALSRTCENVSAVLANGPDPGSDPVGYAEAQVLPLKQVHTTDHDLQTAIDVLDSAYDEYFTTDGSTASSTAVKTAADKLDAICPGATS